MFEKRVMINEAVLIIKSRNTIEVLNHTKKCLKGVMLNGSPVVDHEECWTFPPSSWFKVNVQFS